MGRTPDGTPPCTGSDVLEIVGLLTSAGVDVWVDGGWGIDALLGEQTRPHADLDVALPTRPWQLAQQALARRASPPRPIRTPDSTGLFAVVDLSAPADIAS